MSMYKAIKTTAKGIAINAVGNKPSEIPKD